MNKIKVFKKVTALIAASLLIGCAGSPKPEPPQTALGRWHNLPIHADGSKEDWPKSAPQYENSKTETKMWINNDATRFCLLAEVKNPEIARQLIQGNLILSVKTDEKDAKPFLIQLKGHKPFKPHGRPGQNPDRVGTKEAATSLSMPQDRPPESRPEVQLPDTLMVTYPFSSGPVTMSMKEARSTGIALGLADTGRHTLIFEATINFDAIFFNVPPIAGTILNISLSATDRPSAMEQRESLKGNQDERPQGKPPGGEPPDHRNGPGKPDGERQKKSSNEAFRAVVEITLAGPTE
nr:hypothetical protein [uncultured Desulfobacter sp.]